jgi:hypothetical protein
MAQNIADFKKFVGNYRSIIGFVTGAAGVSSPLLLGLSGISPPWPKGITTMTALIVLVVLILVYFLLGQTARLTIKRLMVCAAVAITVFSLLYLIAYSTFVFQIPTTRELGIKGFVCTADARLVYGDRCPFLGDAELKRQVFDAEAYWTKGSITAARLLLVAGWSVCFGALSLLVGSFVVVLSRKSNSRG